jgi:hypothetical protein
MTERGSWTKATARAALAMLAIAAAGCAGAAAVAPAPAPMPVSVAVAEPVYCKIPIPADPALAIAALGADSPPADTVRAYASSVAVLKAAVRQRDALLEACAPPAPTPAKTSAK